MTGEQDSKDLSVDEFLRFRDLVHKHSGIYLEESKLDSLRISLVTRSTRLGLPRLADYLPVLERDEREFNELMNLVTINETSFFRFPAQFDALREVVLPEIMAGKRPEDRTLRLWSAGCSTGEEPYSISMTALDMGLDGLGWNVNVHGTDVSTRALARAQVGEYGRRTMMNITPEVIRRHFEQLGTSEQYRVNARVRSIVNFEYQNLIKEPYPLGLVGKWDVIFCRNVTIYFRMESTKRVVANFYESLNPGGYLFIGHSETLSSISDAFEPVEIDGVFLYRRPLVARSVFAKGAALSRDAHERSKRDAAGRTAASAGSARHVARTPIRAEATPPVRPAAGAVPQPADRRPTDSGPMSDPSAAGAVPTLDAARISMVQGDARGAVEMVAGILAENPNDADAHLLYAYLHADAGNYDEALRASHRALAINPLLPFARYILGIIYQRQGDAVRAVSELKKTLYIDADFALAHLNLANIYKAQRKWDSAAREYDNALSALRKSPDGEWTRYSGGFKADLLVRTCERSLVECRKAMGAL